MSLFLKSSWYLKRCFTKYQENKSIERKQNQQIKKLSFGDDDENDEEEEENDDEHANDPLCKKRFGKNPDVDTSFLPDVERDEEENKLREQLVKLAINIYCCYNIFFCFDQTWVKYF